MRPPLRAANSWEVSMLVVVASTAALESGTPAEKRTAAATAEAAKVFPIESLAVISNAVVTLVFWEAESGVVKAKLISIPDKAERRRSIHWVARIILAIVFCLKIVQL